MKTEGFGILSACEHVHMCSTGAAASSRDEIMALVAGLQERLENWRASDSTYDQAVKKLMWAAIVDGMKFLATSEAIEEAIEDRYPERRLPPMTDATKKKYSVTTTDLYDHSHSFIVETSEPIEEYVK